MLICFCQLYPNSEAFSLTRDSHFEVCNTMKLLYIKLMYFKLSSTLIRSNKTIKKKCHSNQQKVAVQPTVQNSYGDCQCINLWSNRETVVNIYSNAQTLRPRKPQSSPALSFPVFPFVPLAFTCHHLPVWWFIYCLVHHSAHLNSIFISHCCFWDLNFFDVLMMQLVKIYFF